MNNDVMNERQMALLNIQQIAFTLVDLNLYLNTHPNDQMALVTYNTLYKQREEMMMAYTAKFGPLMNFGHAPGGMETFQWIDSPWPWQPAANASIAFRG